ncbi:ATP-dependent Rna helicase [Cardiosporidium cionae]|uniref:RNA helicase n=1 Tax=Cardiosporidium cionae TaxID=476202 RepID=A0ABQ7J9V5_9APIC|nr:ATP-dependent Rna helicase [Cardiosporidium cionae]|eukprot:KAF8820783.1 ATP-dependent Rna helicase [Cardiosporidium cionae]
MKQNNRGAACKSKRLLPIDEKQVDTSLDHKLREKVCKEAQSNGKSGNLPHASKSTRKVLTLASIPPQACFAAMQPSYSTQRRHEYFPSLHSQPEADAFTMSSTNTRSPPHVKINVEQLPIILHRQTILQTIRKNQVTIIVGATGTGKSTQLPQFLHSENFTNHGIIGITQPRRIAAMALSKRVSEEMEKGRVGGFVGFSVRFHDITSPATRIKYMTDGILVRDSLIDPLFNQYSVIIVDEAHERSLRTDVLMGLLVNILAKRKDLKLIIMSATLQYQQFLRFFKNSDMVMIPGRQYPVDIFYTYQPEQDYIEAALITILQIHLRSAPGGILVFLPGQEDIMSLCNILEEKNKMLNLIKIRQREANANNVNTHDSTANLNSCSIDSRATNRQIYNATIGHDVYDNATEWLNMLIYPIYSSLPVEQQVDVFKISPSDTRKIILATNIAETSITIPGIKYVVDCGLVKVKTFHPKTGMEILKTQEICKASANQRSGRAGRESQGQAYRLYTEKSFQELEEHTLPEILRSDLAQVYLELKAMKVKNPAEFPFINPPDKESLYVAGKTLFRLEAIDRMGEITEFGKRLVSLPLNPLLGKLLLDSITLNCTSEILTIVAMLSAESIFHVAGNLTENERKAVTINQRRLAHKDGDHLTLLNAYLVWEEATNKVSVCREYGLSGNSMLRARNIREQLKEIMMSPSIGIKSISKCNNMTEWDRVRQCLTMGCWLNTARLDPGGKMFLTEINRQAVYLHPASVLFNRKPLPHWVIYSEFVHTKKPYIKDVSIIEGAWLQKLVPRCFGARDPSL